MNKVKKKTIFLYIPLIIIISFSLLNLYKLHYLNNKSILVYKQLLWFIIFIIIIFFFKKINIKKLFNISSYLYLLNTLLLILVLIWGNNIHGAKAWFKIGIFSFQPSELMKITLSLYLINLATDYKNESKTIIKMIITLIIPSILVFLEPDTGAIIFYLIIFLTIISCSKLNKKWLYILLSIGIITFSTLIYIYFYNQELLINLLGSSMLYRIERLLSFKNDEVYQLNNALTVIGSANLIDFNFNSSLYIPEATTDFMFSFHTGNFGLIPSILILLCYISILYYLVNMYKYVKDIKIKLFLSSFINIFLINIFINITMNLGLVPIIGIPLPLLSYGGSTIIIYAIYFGIILKSNNT